MQQKDIKDKYMLYKRLIIYIKICMQQKDINYICITLLLNYIHKF